MRTTKVCKHCGETKATSAFRGNARTKDGLSSWCSACHVESTRRWRAENPDKVAAYNQARRVVPS